MEKAMRDRSKLTPKVIIDKNGHSRKVYVRLVMEVDKKGNMKRWDVSDDLARTLQAADFGRPDLVMVMAHMDRQPKSYAQAREILTTLVDRPMVSNSGLHATLSKNSIEEILSGTSGSASYDLKAHLLAAGNIDQLYANAIEPWKFEMNPHKDNSNMVGIHRLFAPMEYNGNIIVVKITVKEMKNPKDGNRIYTIKALDVFLKE